MRRRDFIAAAAAALGCAKTMPAESSKSPFGVCIYSYWTTRFPDTLAFLDHCRPMGAAGIQMPVKPLTIEAARAIRVRAAQYGMYYEGIVALPKTDPAGFEHELAIAREAGAAIVRSACLSGRRYETFSSMADWNTFVEASHRSLDLAVPALEKAKMTLALENHKDWTVPEFLALLKRYSSERLGVCLDFGNNIALCESPDLVARLVPYAVSTHVKDIALTPNPQGFRMAEVPLGQGVVDVHSLIAALAKARPSAKLNLEMITRDPLLIPSKTDKYWATFPDRRADREPATLAFVDAHSTKAPLAQISPLDESARAKVSDQNVAACLRFT